MIRFLNSTLSFNIDDREFWGQKLFSFMIAHVGIRDILDHLLYSPFFRTSDYYFFQHLKNCLIFQKFDYSEELNNSIKNWPQTLDVEFYAEGLKNLVSRYQKCFKRNSVGNQCEYHNLKLPIIFLFVLLILILLKTDPYAWNVPRTYNRIKSYIFS